MRGNYGDSKFYQVVCACGQEYHEHTLEVAAAVTGIDVNIYATAKTDYWSSLVEKRYDLPPWSEEVDWFIKDLINGLWTRLKVTWEVWTTGAVTVQTTLSMTEQQALNYAETLKSAVKDVKDFSNKQASSANTKAVLKQANEGDCI